MRFICRFPKKDSAWDANLKQRNRNPETFHSIPELRKYLHDIYGDKCCYCETSLKRPNASFQVDHFYPQKLPNKQKNGPYVYDIENFHLSCSRCNDCKKMYNGKKGPYYTGPALSPNYYINALGKWELSSSSYISDHIHFVGPFVRSEKYDKFIDTLKLNGLDDLYRSPLQDRAHYLYKTMIEIKDCFEYAEYNKAEAKKRFKEISKKFDERAEYSTMVIRVLGKKYIELQNQLKKRISICKLLKKSFEEIRGFFFNR